VTSPRLRWRAVGALGYIHLHDAWYLTIGVAVGLLVSGALIGSVFLMGASLPVALLASAFVS